MVVVDDRKRLLLGKRLLLVIGSSTALSLALSLLFFLLLFLLFSLDTKKPYVNKDIRLIRYSLRDSTFKVRFVYLLTR